MWTAGGDKDNIALSLPKCERNDSELFQLREVCRCQVFMILVEKRAVVQPGAFALCTNIFLQLIGIFAEKDMPE